jgi:hypothetical protein
MQMGDFFIHDDFPGSTRDCTTIDRSFLCQYRSDLQYNNQGLFDSAIQNSGNNL